MPTVTPEDLLRVCKNLGYEVKRRSDHLFMEKAGQRLIKIPNPHNKKDIGPGLLSEILRQFGISKEEFERLRKK